MKRRFVLLSAVLGVLLVVLAACGGGTTVSPGSGSSSMSGQDVQVTLSEYKVTSSVTSFLPGMSYHFVVKNTGHIAHEFMIVPAGMMSGMSMDDMDKMALAVIDSVAPGETKTIDYTFSSSDASKSLELACHIPGHYEAGMKLGISFTK